MPFSDDSFDVVWTEHAQMNIGDKMRFYGEMTRVLRSGGRIAFHDVFQGENRSLEFPVPWAADPSISFLVPAESVRKLLESFGLRCVYWEDRTSDSLEFFNRRIEVLSREGPPPLGLHLLMGADAVQKFKNLARNLQQNSVQVFQGVFETPVLGCYI